MKFSIIGTGNMAWFMAPKITMAGHQCSYVYGRNKAAATELANMVNGTPTDRLRDIKDNDDAVIIAVSDDSVQAIADKLVTDEAVLIHTAGSLSMDMLGEATHKAVIWPIYSILRSDIPAHRNIPCAIEYNSINARGICRNLVHALSDVLIEANLQQRQWMHIAAVFNNNFINHMMTVGEQIFKEQGFDFALLKPMLQNTIERMDFFKPREVQTGPASRGDDHTINAQLQILTSHPKWKEMYSAITNSIREMHSQKQTETVTN